MVGFLIAYVVCCFGTGLWITWRGIGTFDWGAFVPGASIFMFIGYLVGRKTLSHGCS